MSGIINMEKFIEAKKRELSLRLYCYYGEAEEGNDAEEFELNCLEWFERTINEAIKAIPVENRIMPEIADIEFRPSIEDVDEIVAHNAFVHLEYLDKWDIWMSIETEKEKYQIHIQPRNKRSNASLLTFAEKIG